jgi:signal transduction histidine kinase
MFRATEVEHARAIATITRDAVTLLMQSGHGRDLQPLLDHFRGNADVVALRILSPDGVVQRSMARGEIGRRLAEHQAATSMDGTFSSALPFPRPTPAILHTSTPLRNQPLCQQCHTQTGAFIGTLDVDIDLSRQAEALGGWWRLNAGVSAVQMLVVVGLTTGILTLLVVRPIRRLIDGFERVRAGDLRPEPPGAGSYEVDELVTGFNAMVLRLREASRAEEAARRLQAQRAEHLATVAQMAADLAHEIRNPLGGVKAVLQVTARQLRDDPPKREILARAEQELDRIEETIQTLLEYARPRAPDLTPIDLNGCVGGALDLLRTQAETQGHQLLWQPARSLPHVSADESLVRQVVTNLVVNALQAIRDLPGARVVVSTAREGDEVVCRVVDTGPGVPAEHATTIFGVFFTTKSRGTGLGLAISRRWIEVQGGRLWLENPGEPGASFAFAFGVRDGV